MNTYKLLHKGKYIIIMIIIMSSTAHAQVGVETSDPKTTLDVNAALSLRDGGLLTLVNGENNNAIDLGASPFSFYRITGPTLSFDVGGILPVNVPDGQMVTLQNTTDQIMTIVNYSANAAGPSRIAVPNGKDLMVRGKYACVTFQYSKGNNKWYLLNKLNHAETWYYPPKDLGSKTTLTFTAGLPGATINSGFSISVVGPSPDNMPEDIVIEYKEAILDGLIFRVRNNSKNTTYKNVQFAITVYKD